MLNGLEFEEIMKQQRYLEATADIPYMCYTYKLTQSEFFRHYLWVWALHQGIIDSIPRDIADQDLSAGIIIQNAAGEDFTG